MHKFIVALLVLSVSLFTIHTAFAYTTDSNVSVDENADSVEEGIDDDSEAPDSATSVSEIPDANDSAPAPDANSYAPAPDANSYAPAPRANDYVPAPDANSYAPAPDANSTVTSP